MTGKMVGPRRTVTEDSMKTGSGLLAIVMGAIAVIHMPLTAAQDYLGAYQDAQQFQRQLQNMQDNARAGAERNSARRGQREASGEDAAASTSDARAQGLAALDFQPSPAVTARVNRALADVLAGREPGGASGAVEVLGAVVRDDPRLRELLASQLGGDRAAIVAALDTGVLHRRHSERLAARGYSAHNVADVNNAFLIHAWGFLHGPGFDVDGLYAAQRARSRKALAATGAPPAMSGEAKQDLAETLALLQMLSGAAWSRHPDPADRAVLQEGLAGVARLLGVDLHAARATAQGLAER
jgi:hypothetical protein